MVKMKYIILTILAILTISLIVSIPFMLSNQYDNNNQTITLTKSIECKSIMVTQTNSITSTNKNITFYLNNQHGYYPNGTSWISIDNKIYNNYTMIDYGTLPSNGWIYNWYKMNSCKTVFK